MDQRTAWEKKLDNLIGPPLYYCDCCKRAVSVKATNGEPVIERPCECDAQIIAPRKAIAAGEGGLNMSDRAKLAYWQVAAALTGRCV